LPRLIPTAIAAGGGAVLASAVLLASGGVGSSAAPRPTFNLRGAANTTTVSSSSRVLTASQVYQRDRGGVVSIQATTSQGQDTGTGVVISSDGLIVTNDHVVSGASSVTVTPGTSSSSIPAQIVGEDPDADLAVVKVDPSGANLHPLTLADSSKVKVGDATFAIGTPYGLNQTLTTGIVSALGRQISAPDGATINDAIQTDAPLNPGNSGGPLLDSHGRVIGINSQIASEQTGGGGQPGSTGVGFAISSNTVEGVVQQIKANGNVAPSAGTQQQQQQTPYGNAGPNGGGTIGPNGGGTIGPNGGGTIGPNGGGTIDPNAGGQAGGSGQVLILPDGTQVQVGP
jgi:putative serine protease PepD